jgi:hypothetical protein
VPDGCSVTYTASGELDEVTAAPGHLCMFYEPHPEDAQLGDITSPHYERYGRHLYVEPAAGPYCGCPVSADVVWAMTPPNRRMTP